MSAKRGESESSSGALLDPTLKRQEGNTLWAPWESDVRYPVQPLGKGSQGNVLVKWLDGPLKGHEARLNRSALHKAEAKS